MKLTGKQLALMVAFTLFSLASIGLLLWAWNTGQRAWAKPAILLISSGYVAVALGAAPWRTGFGRAMLAAIIFCWLGDQGGPVNFVFGVVMYAFCHACLVAAFLLYGISKQRFLIATLIMAYISLLVVGWLGPHIPPHERGMILGYMAVITAMMLFAGAVRPPGHLLLWLGVILFYISDLWLARNMYVQQGILNRNIGYPMYYAACLVLAWCAALQPPERLAKERSDML